MALIAIVASLALSKAAFGYSPFGTAARNAPSTTTAPNVGSGPTYVSPYARAIALVHGIPGFAVIGSKGFTSITNPATGIYCFTLSGVVQISTAPVVSIEWGDSFGVVLFAQWNRAQTSCGGGANVIEVRTYKGDSGGVGSGYQTPVLSNSVAFVVYVP